MVHRSWCEEFQIITQSRSEQLPTSFVATMNHDLSAMNYSAATMNHELSIMNFPQ